MLFFLVSRHPSNRKWSKRGTLHAKTPNRAIKDFRRLFCVSNRTEVKALSGCYPKQFTYVESPKTLALRDA